MKFNLFKYAASDGLIFHGIHFGLRFKKVVVYVHGLGGGFYRSDYLLSLERELRKKKIGLVAINTRGNHVVSSAKKGNGEYVVCGSAYEVFDECLYDLEGILKFLKGKKVILLGHSTGANKAAFAALHKLKFAKFIFAAPGDDVGGQLELLGRAKFVAMQQHAIKLKKKDPKLLMPVKNIGAFPISAESYHSLFRKNSSMDLFPYRSLSLKSWSRLKSLGSNSYVILGSDDEHLTAPLADIQNFFEESLSQIKFSVIDGGNHSFKGKEKVFAKLVADFCVSK